MRVCLRIINFLPFDERYDDGCRFHNHYHSCQYGIKYNILLPHHITVSQSSSQPLSWIWPFFDIPNLCSCFASLSCLYYRAWTFYPSINLQNSERIPVRVKRQSDDNNRNYETKCDKFNELSKKIALFVSNPCLVKLFQKTQIILIFNMLSEELRECLQLNLFSIKFQ